MNKKTDLAKIISAISKIKPRTTKKLKPTNKIMDAENVYMIIDLQGTDILKFFNTEQDTELKKPNIAREGYQRVKLSLEYLKKIIKLMETESDTITLFVKDDYPLITKGERFACIQAPRISDTDPDKSEELKTILEEKTENA